MHSKFTLTASILLSLSTPVFALGLNDCVPLNNALAVASIEEHLFGGAPDDRTPLPRRAYVLAYDIEHKVPAWAYWRAIPEYRETPEREGKWKDFRSELSVTDVVSDDYLGWHASSENFARGHIVPFFISGGDRDDDGQDANIGDTLAIADDDDACTVFEVNSMINIAPQYHDRFNGQGGVWGRLEGDVRDMIADDRSFTVIAGSVFVEGREVQKIGPILDPTQHDIGVPHAFFKIVIDVEYLTAVAFLFDHQSDLDAGCDIDVARFPSQCVVAIEEVESATGLQFFAELSDVENDLLRETSHSETWLRWRRLADVN